MDIGFVDVWVRICVTFFTDALNLLSLTDVIVGFIYSVYSLTIVE